MFCRFYEQLTLNNCSIKVAGDRLEHGSSGIGINRAVNCTTPRPNTFSSSIMKDSLVSNRNRRAHFVTANFFEHMLTTFFRQQKLR